MISSWDGFFGGQVAAGSALTGLLFVALSINLQRIVGYPGLVGRAGEALLLLVLPVFIGLAALQPGQALRTVGIELLAITAVVAVVVLRTLATSGRAAAHGRPHHEFATRCTLAIGAMAPGVVAGLMLIGGNDDGFYAQAIATGLCLAAGITDAWVLLVEIVR
jgi:hypothetical protein